MAQREGFFSWVDLLTQQPEAVADFYSELLGWERESALAADDYFTFRLGGDRVGGIALVTDDTLDAGLPTGWFVWIAVDSIDSALNSARDLGGQVLLRPFDLDDGRGAVLRDPSGAAFGVHENRLSLIQRFGTPGALAGAELATPDVEGAATFYASLFDWTTERLSSDYSQILLDSAPLGGIYDSGISPKGLPAAAWGVYFNVEDVDMSASLAEALGGGVVTAPMDIPGDDGVVGRVVVLEDPDGNSFGLTTLSAGLCPHGYPPGFHVC